MATNKGKTGTKNTQTSGYTPSKSVVKVVDPRTGKPYMYDKQYDAIFDTNGNQLDSDDFRHIREVMSTGKDIAYSKLVAKKKQELKDNGITSEFAKVYRAGDSEKALRLLNRAFYYHAGVRRSENLESEKTLNLIKLLAKQDNKTSSNTYKETPLLWSLGMPAKKENEDTAYGSWGISENRPTRNSENYPYYFTPIADIENPSKERKEVISEMLKTGLKEYGRNTTVDEKGKIHSKFENKSIPLMDWSWVGNLGNYGASVAPDSSYFAFHDLWNLDPSASHNRPVFLPKAVYRKVLTSAGVPESEQEAMITGFLRGDSATEILGFSPEGFKKGVPIYDRIYKDPVTGKTIKEMLKENTYAYGGKVKKYANGGKLPIDMYGRLVKKYEDGGRTPINVAPIESLPAGIIQDLEYQKYVDKINSNGIAKVAQSPGLLSTKSSNATGDVVGAIGNIAGGFLSSAGTKQVEKGRMVGGTAMQAAGAVAPIATNPALLAATGGLSALAIPLAAGIGALAGIPKQKKYNRIERGNDIEEQLAMYQGMDIQNNYMQDPIRYAAYGGKINHYGDGGETYDPTTDPNLMKEVVITAARKNVVADMLAGIIDNMNTSGASKNRKNNLELMKTLTAYLQNPMQTSNFLNMSTGTAPTFYGYNNVAQFPGTYMPKAAYGGQQGELAQLEQLNGVKENYIDKYGRTKTTNATESHKSMEMKGKANMPTDYLQNGDNIFSAKSYSKDELKTILDAHEALTGENVKLGLDVLTPYYNTKNKTKISPADINKVVAKKFNPKNLTNNSFNTAAINARNQTYANLATTKFNDALNPATFQGIAQQTEQILHAAYGGRMKKYAYGGDPEDEPGYRSGNSSWAGAPGAGLRDAQYPPAMFKLPTVNIPGTVIDIPTILPPTPPHSDGPYRMTPKAFTTYIEPKSVYEGMYDNEPIDISPEGEQAIANEKLRFEKEQQRSFNYDEAAYYARNKTPDTTAPRNKKPTRKLSLADIAALGVGGANAMASLLTLQQKMYDNEITDKSNVYNMKTELPDNFTNPTLGALRAGLQSTNNWKNTSAMSSEMLAKTVAGLNAALLEQSRQNVGLFNAKQAAIYQALGIDTANKQAWNKDKTALSNYKLSAIVENLLKMASSGNTRAAENALAQMDDATLRAMLVTIGPNSKYFTEQIERIINSRKGSYNSQAGTPK